MIILELTESSNRYPDSNPVASLIGNWKIDDAEQCLAYFYNVIVKSHAMESYNQAINLLLDAGKQRFGMDYALVTRPVSESVYEVQAFSCEEDGRFYVGQHISTASSLCHRVRGSGDVCSVSDVAKTEGTISQLAYAGVNVGSYVGAQVKTHFAASSILCFFSSAPKQQSIDAEDENLLEMLAQGVAYLVDQQKTQAQRKNIDSTMFANGSLNTLDEYLEQAKLPELYGIPGRVVEVLKKRIGESALSIGHISDELTLSKRTLQRRLQQQNVNFAELRDQVRYHYSIDYLVKNRKSIDSISTALDFSDRTSFTNAFKRWTGMSPSTFRKLFRDFV
ncbi:helix-turn-helix domain-containing protein [Agarilytica rhodophyticola]|uniref:helix-turn-helix domain-containing protein n=1 Tax=Agarilytica rhodophyticola TaxID=1737490 RepID=UPI001FE60271|nr:AraC family transcriptional regulator [Agarilytica rhodophyticola]